MGTNYGMPPEQRATKPPGELENIAETLARELPTPQILSVQADGLLEHVALPPGWKLDKIDSSALESTPRYLAGVARLDDADSFAAYVSRMRGEHTLIWCKFNPATSELQFTAVFDENGNDAPQWRKHRAVFVPGLSVEWKLWAGINGTKLDQLTFAQFIEDQELDIHQRDETFPSALQMHELATNFKYHAESALKSNVRTQDGGVKLEYVNTADAETAKAMKLFERFGIAIPVWQGSPKAYRLDVRVRFRVNSGRLTFWFELVRPDLAHRQAALELIELVKQSVEVPLLMGEM